MSFVNFSWAVFVELRDGRGGAGVGGMEKRTSSSSGLMVARSRISWMVGSGIVMEIFLVGTLD